MGCHAGRLVEHKDRLIFVNDGDVESYGRRQCRGQPMDRSGKHYQIAGDQPIAFFTDSTINCEQFFAYGSVNLAVRNMRQTAAHEMVKANRC